MREMKVLVLSTAHITEKTDRLLTDGPVPGSVMLAPWPDTGWFFYVDDDLSVYELDDQVPGDLYGVLCYAKINGFDWLRLEADEPATGELPTYNW